MFTARKLASSGVQQVFQWWYVQRSCASPLTLSGGDQQISLLSHMPGPLTGTGRGIGVSVVTGFMLDLCWQCKGPSYLRGTWPVQLRTLLRLKSMVWSVDIHAWHDFLRLASQKFGAKAIGLWFLLMLRESDQSLEKTPCWCQMFVAVWYCCLGLALMCSLQIRSRVHKYDKYGTN